MEEVVTNIPVDTQAQEEEARKQLEIEIAAKSEEELIKYLEGMNPIEVYIIIRDYIKLPQEKKLRALKDTDKILYQRYQDIKKTSKEYWDYDHKVAEIRDINKACMNVYQALLGAIKHSNNSNDVVFENIMGAINRIEEHIGLEKTIWVDEASISEAPIV